jgi:RimJ/RimL family protein N-acetyltransferase
MEVRMVRKLLSGNKIYFRLVEKEDLINRVEWINDLSVQETLHFDYPTSFARTQKWFDTIVMDKTRVDFSIFLLESKEYIGFCGLLNIDQMVKKAELYMTIGKRTYWGSGFGTEAYKLLTNYGFLELGLNRIYGCQNIDNHVAFHIKEKIGWKKEGTLRSDIYAHGKVYDRNVMAILREEWEVNPGYDF